jgi:hypothetical protein
MSKSNIQTQLTQWVSKKAEKRCCDDSTGPIMKKLHTSDPQSSNSNNIIPITSSKLSQNDESTKVILIVTVQFVMTHITWTLETF